MSLEAERGMLVGIHGLMPCLPSSVGLVFSRSAHEPYREPKEGLLAFLTLSWPKGFLVLIKLNRPTLPTAFPVYVKCAMPWARLGTRQRKKRARKRKEKKKIPNATQAP